MKVPINLLPLFCLIIVLKLRKGNGCFDTPSPQLPLFEHYYLKFDKMKHPQLLYGG
jgi:hypothetical protein